MAQELEQFSSTITASTTWIKTEAKWLVPEELSFLLTGLQVYIQVSTLDDEDDIKVSMRMRAIRDLMYFRSLMVAKIYRAGFMGLEEKKANYLLAGRATCYIKTGYMLLGKSDIGRAASDQLMELFPDFEKVTGLTQTHMEAGLFPKY